MIIKFAEEEVSTDFRFTKGEAGKQYDGMARTLRMESNCFQRQSLLTDASYN